MSRRELFRVLAGCGKTGFLVNFPLRCDLFIGRERDYGVPQSPVTRFRTVAEGAGQFSTAGSCGCAQKVAHPHQVIGRQCEAEYPIDARDPTMASLTQTAHGLEPAEDLFHPFALALTDHIARMAGGALVDNTGFLAREMRSYSMLAHLLNQFFAIVAFVGAQRYSTPTRNLFHHRQRRLRFGAAGSLSYTAVDRQPVTILHQHMSGVAQLRLFAFALARAAPADRSWTGEYHCGAAHRESPRSGCQDH